MQEALLTIAVVVLLLIGLPWMAYHFSFGQQMAVCGAMIFIPLIATLLWDEFSP